MRRTLAIVLAVLLLVSVMPVAALASSTYMTYHITGNGVNIRSGPGTGYPKVGSALARGTGVYGLSASGNWRRVKVFKTGSTGGKTTLTGWVSKTYLSSNVRARVATSRDPLVVRSGPGTGYKKRGTLPKNTSVTFSKISGNWAYVSKGGLSGWASLSYLKITRW